MWCPQIVLSVAAHNADDDEEICLRIRNQHQQQVSGVPLCRVLEVVRVRVRVRKRPSGAVHNTRRFPFASPRLAGVRPRISPEVFDWSSFALASSGLMIVAAARARLMMIVAGVVGGTVARNSISYLLKYSLTQPFRPSIGSRRERDRSRLRPPPHCGQYRCQSRLKLTLSAPDSDGSGPSRAPASELAPLRP